jgi:hypothetical protein
MFSEALHSRLPVLRTATPELRGFSIYCGGTSKHLVNQGRPLRDGDRMCGMKS